MSTDQRTINTLRLVANCVNHQVPSYTELPDRPVHSAPDFCRFAMGRNTDLALVLIRVCRVAYSFYLSNLAERIPDARVSKQIVLPFFRYTQSQVVEKARQIVLITAPLPYQSV